MDDRDLAVGAERHALPSHQVLAWHGWGSPVGVGILLVAIGGCALLLRLALVGLG